MNAPVNDPKAGFTPRSETAAVTLRNRILDGEYAPGTPLQEVPLSQEMGVSRTPIREALSILSKEGLLEPGPKRSFKVKTFTLDEIRHAYELRGCLEGFACRHLAEVGLSDEVDARLEACLRHGDELLAKGLEASRQDEWLEMNNELHATLVEACENPFLSSFVHQTHHVPLASARHVHWYAMDERNFDLARKAHEHHHGIVQAIRDRQSARAGFLMEEHVAYSFGLVSEYAEGFQPK
ncbi:MAG: GntR family transcriptional regulator [Pseudomonadota bacterium]|nr:GntR family transcriptional regulator [Pseudomonadota bacterium]